MLSYIHPKETLHGLRPNLVDLGSSSFKFLNASGKKIEIKASTDPVYNALIERFHTSPANDPSLAEAIKALLDHLNKNAKANGVVISTLQLGSMFEKHTTLFAQVCAGIVAIQTENCDAANRVAQERTVNPSFGYSEGILVLGGGAARYKNEFVEPITSIGSKSYRRLLRALFTKSTKDKTCNPKLFSMGLQTVLADLCFERITSELQGLVADIKQFYRTAGGSNPGFGCVGLKDGQVAAYEIALDARKVAVSVTQLNESKIHHTQFNHDINTLVEQTIREPSITLFKGQSVTAFDVKPSTQGGAAATTSTR